MSCFSSLVLRKASECFNHGAVVIETELDDTSVSRPPVIARTYLADQACIFLVVPFQPARHRLRENLCYNFFAFHASVSFVVVVLFFRDESERMSE